MWWLVETIAVCVFAMGWFPCCCDTPEVICSFCIDSAAPLEYQVEVSGVADANCTSCSANNDGTYILPHTTGCVWSLSGLSIGHQTWSTTGGTTGCKAALTSISLRLGDAFNPNDAMLSFGETTAFLQDEGHNFRNAGVKPLDCMNLLDYSIAYLNSTESGAAGFACTWSGATVLVTTL